MGMYFTNDVWLWVNAPSFGLMAFAAWQVARGRWPTWVVVSLATHLALHSLGRIPTSLWFWKMQAGLLSGLAIGLPLALPTLVRGWRELPRAAFRRGVVVGIVSFQPLWHFALLPVLPWKAPAA